MKQIQPPGKSPMEFSPVVLINEAEKEFRWKGKLFVKGVFDGEHYFKLESLGPNQTRFIHGEQFTGVLSGALLKMIGENTQAGFMEMDEALKAIVENKTINA